ncbi:MAG: hypothetical protein ACJ79K_07975 [Gemmatimonadaceae bacterium]
MTFEPNLVWTHLFPGDVSFEPLAPAGMLDALRVPARDGTRRVLVSHGQPTSALPDLDGFDGLAAINCRALRGEQLRDAGFEYVRHFAMLPSFASLRWLIPLDSAAVSASAFHLFAAVRVATRIKHLLARGAARSGVPIWYRDSIWVAQRRTPPLAKAINSLFPSRQIALAMSSGAPGPAERRKPSLAVMDEAGRTLAFVKVAVSPISDALVRNEAAVLAGLPLAAPGALAPRAIFAGEIDGRFALVQTPVSGRPPGPGLTPAHHKLLDSLRRPERKPLLETSWGRSIRDRVVDGPVDRELLRAFDECAGALDGEHVPTAVVHGDFVPWNLRGSPDTLAAYDWENASLDGVPIADELHHRLVVGHLMSGWSADRAVREVDTAVASHGLLLGQRQATALAVAYLIEHTTRLIEHTHNANDPMLVWYREVLARTAARLGTLHHAGKPLTRGAA